MSKVLTAVLLMIGSALAVHALAADQSTATGKADDAVTLEPFTVVSPVAPLDRSLWLLKKLAETSTPCLGCDAKPASESHSPALSLLEYLLLPSEPPALDAAARLAVEVRHADSGPYLGFWPR